jgi:WD40 repeat protein
MSLRKRRTLLVAGLLAVALAAVLIGRLHPRGNLPGGDVDRSKTLVGHTLPVQNLVFSHDGITLTTAAYYLATTLPAMKLTVWDVATGMPTAKSAAPLQAFRCLAFAPGGRRVAAAGLEESGAWLWDTDAAQQRRRLGEHDPLVCSLAFSGDGSQLAIADFEEVVTLWDVDRGRPQIRCRGDVLALSFAPDGRMLAGGGRDHTVRLWEVASGEERGVLAGHARSVMALAFAPDGRVLAAVDRSGVVKLWDVAARRERATLVASQDKGAFEEVTAVAFAPDGRMLAVAVDQAVQLWEVASGRRVASLEGHEGKVQCLAYSPDGTLLASGGHDRTVRLWDVANVLRQRPDK